MEIVRFRNGLTVVLDPSPSPTAAVAIASRHGARYERMGNSGLYHLVEHFLLRASSRFPTQEALLTAMDRMHAEYNATTSHDLILAFGEVESRYAVRLLQVLTDGFLHPLLRRTELPSEQRVVGIEEIQDDADPVDRSIQLFLRTCFFETPLANPILGSPSSRRRFTIEHLRKLWRRITRPGDVTVVVSGRFDRETILAPIRRTFGRLTPGPPGPVPMLRVEQHGRRIRFENGHGRRDAVTVTLGFPTPGYAHANRLPLAILANAIGGKDSSQLFTDLRTHGLVYDVEAFAWHYRDVGYFAIQTTGRRSKLPAILHRMLWLLREHKERPMDSATFHDAVRYLQSGARTLRHQPLRRAKLYAAQTALYGSPVDDRAYASALAELDRHRVHAVAKRTFVGSRLNAAIIGRLTPKQRRAIRSILHL